MRAIGSYAGGAGAGPPDHSSVRDGNRAECGASIDGRRIAAKGGDVAAVVDRHRAKRESTDGSYTIGCCRYVGGVVYLREGGTRDGHQQQGRSCCIEQGSPAPRNASRDFTTGPLLCTRLIVGDQYREHPTT